ncbi:hypothetical protein CHCC20375_2159 [Bacillus licheniformis]|nr:hypothetical protein CHCC20375_2159 [Bacillus licheniformis]
MIEQLKKPATVRNEMNTRPLSGSLKHYFKIDDFIFPAHINTENLIVLLFKLSV